MTVSGSLDGPSSTYLDERHVHNWEHVEIAFDRFAEDKDGTLKAEVVIESALPPHPGRIYGPAKLNLLSGQTLSRLASDLSKRAAGFDWTEALRVACDLSINRWREGDPLELVDAASTHERQWVIEPYIEADGATVLFAQGGSGKGFFALAIALSVATGVPILGVTPAIVGPVAYLDWEASKRETDRRITMLARAHNITNPPIWYRREQASLDTTAHSLAQQLAHQKCVLAIIDSKGMAAKGAPESAEPTINLLRAIRRLRIPCLVIDHIGKAAIGGEGPDMAYGSVYTTNGARLAWSMKSSYTAGEVASLLTNTKANNGPKAKPRIVSFTFTDDRVEVSHSADLGRLTEDSRPVASRIDDYLDEHSTASIRELSSALSLPEDTVRKTLSRWKDKGRYEQVGGLGAWRLVAPTDIF